jgi:hypothetical protein
MNNEIVTADNEVNDADYLISLFEDGTVPPTTAHDAAVPDYYREDAVVFEAGK